MKIAGSLNYNTRSEILRYVTSQWEKITFARELCHEQMEHSEEAALIQRFDTLRVWIDYEEA